MDTRSLEAVQYLAKAFRAGVALRAALDSTFEKFGCLAWSTAEAQRALLNETVFYTTGLPPHTMEYPFGYARCARFVRLLMDELDRLDSYDLDEGLAEHAARLCQTKRGRIDELAYVMYELGTCDARGRGRNVAVRCSVRFDDLGRRVWEGGVALCAQLLRADSALAQWMRGRRVLELGAGTGVCAAGYAHAGVDYALLTDLEPRAVANMQCNIAAVRRPRAARVETRVLDAREVGAVTRVARERAVDTVVAADVNYDEEVAACMAEAVAAVVRGGGGECGGVVVVTERNEGGAARMRRRLQDGGVRVEEVECVDAGKGLEYLGGWELSRVRVYRVWKAS